MNPTPVATERDTLLSPSPDKVRTFTGHTLPIYSLAFSPDGRWLVSGSLDKTAKLWDLSDGRELRTFTGNRAFTSVEFSPDGRRLALAATNGAPLNDDKPEGNAITLWDSTSPNDVRNLIGHEGQVFFVKFSPDGGFLASTNGAATIHLWDSSSRRIAKTFKHGWIRSKLQGGTTGSSLAFTPDGQYLATRSSPATLWDLSSGKEVRSFGPESYSGFVSMFLGFTPDGKSLIQARGDGAIRLWEVLTGIEARSIAGPLQKSSITFRLRSAALSPDGSLLAVSTYSSAEALENQNKIMLWDIASGRTLGTVTVSDSCYALAFSPDGQWLATADMLYGGGKATGKVRLWRTSEIR
jgi:WD40 repeat protein